VKVWPQGVLSTERGQTSKQEGGRGEKGKQTVFTEKSRDLGLREKLESRLPDKVEITIVGREGGGVNAVDAGGANATVWTQVLRRGDRRTKITGRGGGVVSSRRERTGSGTRAFQGENYAQAPPAFTGDRESREKSNWAPNLKARETTLFNGAKGRVPGRA